MILPNNFDTTPFKLSNLSKRQRLFVEFIYESGHTNADEVVFKRNYLRNIAIAWGAEWAPAWIVKDMSRVTARGFYAIPELTELANELNATASTDVEDSLEVSDDMIGDLDDALSVSDDVSVHVSAS